MPVRVFVCLGVKQGCLIVRQDMSPISLLPHISVWEEMNGGDDSSVLTPKGAPRFLQPISALVDSQVNSGLFSQRVGLGTDLKGIFPADRTQGLGLFVFFPLLVFVFDKY